MHRMRIVAATLVVSVAALGVAACSSMLLGSSGASAGRPIGQDNRSASAVADDRRITATIRQRFAADETLGAANLSIDTRQGVVTLRGALTDFGQRDRAARLATDVAGVVRVQNQISVRSAP